VNIKLFTYKNFRRRLRSAFSLTEGLIGVAVMGIVFISLYTGMATGFQSIRNSRENTRATQILLEKFETIRLYNWDQIANTPGFIPDTFTAKFFPNTTGTTNAGSGITYFGRVTISPVAFTDPYGSDLRSVRITLSWTSDGLTHTRDFVSFVARYGIQNYVF
jgi:type II secretory pathway pseudopilin PulG